MGSSHIIGTNLDYGIIIGYFVLVLGFGAFFGRFTKSTKDFFFSGQRFPWWLIAFSMVATTVGSYSFIKYSAVAFSYGLSSTHTYWNDWFWMPLFVFGWLPIIYYSKITSVPEYFERRFDRPTRLLATIVILLYLLGYIGINFYTLGVALNAMLGWDLMVAVIVIAVISAIYVTAGGQTSVIMTDLLQGLLLLLAGFLLFGLGLAYIGGLDVFWEFTPFRHRLPLAYINKPADFNMLGILWQDGLSQGAFVLFLNQGIMMRFLSAKSVGEGRKAITAVLIVLQVVAALAVAGAGWLGRAMVGHGDLPANSDPNTIFVVVSSILCQPGVFGLIMAALTAALMSTADTLINAVSAVAVNDLWKVYVNPKAEDKQALRMARIVSLAAAAVGVLMVPIYASFKSIYAAHAAFTAMVGPPLAVALLLGAFWKRFSAKAALITIGAGIAAMALSVVWPDVLAPFSLGIPKAGGAGLSGHLKSYFFVRALYGFAVCGGIGIVLGIFLPRKPDKDKDIVGLVWGTIRQAQKRFKGSEPNTKPSKPIRIAVKVVEQAGSRADGRLEIRMPAAARDELGVQPGDLVYVTDPRWWLGGLRSAHAVVSDQDAAGDQVELPKEVAGELGKHLRPEYRIEKIL